MSQFFETLLNTNHEMPDFWTALVLVALAWLVPMIAKKVLAIKQQKRDSSPDDSSANVDKRSKK